VAQRGARNMEVIHAEAAGLQVAEKLNGIFARWLFCFVAEPAEIVRRCAGVLGKGGRLVVMEYWNYWGVWTGPGLGMFLKNYRAIRTAPDSELFRKIFEAVYKSFADAGGSLDVAGDLPEHCARVGLEVVAVEPICQVGRPHSPVWNWVAQFQELYLPTLVEK